MAKIIYEKREFKDRITGITTVYDYIAIAGSDSKSLGYEVALKNLVQSEKMVLKMLADVEGTYNGEVSSRKATENENPSVSKKEDQKDSENWLNDL